MCRRLLFPLALFLSLPAVRAGERLTLMETMRLAARRSLEAQLAEAQSNAAAAEADMEKAAFRPRLSVGTGAAKTIGFPMTMDGAAPSIFQVDFSQSLLDRKQSRRAASSRLRQKSVLARYEEARLQAAMNAGLAYLELRNVRRKTPWLESNRKSLEKTLAVVRTRVEAGLAEPREATEAELALAQAKLELAAEKEKELSLEDELRRDLGLEVDRPLLLSQDPVPFRQEDLSEAVLVEAALESDPTLKELSLEEKSYQAALEAYDRRFQPVVHLIGKYGLLGRYNNYDRYFNHFERNSALFGLSVELPLLAPEVRPEIQQLHAALDGTRLKRRMRARALRMEVRRRLAGLDTLEAKEEVARLELRLADQNLSVSRARYQEGRLMVAELEKARRRESAQKIASLDAGFEREKSLLEIYNRSGRLLNDIQ